VRLVLTAVTKQAAPARRNSTRKVRRIGRPPGQPSEDTRAAILTAARASFARVGFERATNQDIAAAAGITAAALYRYFDSKLDLYVAVVHDAMSEILPRILTAMTNATGLKGAFRALLQMTNTASDNQRSATQFLAALPNEMKRHPEVSQRVLADPGEIFDAFNALVAAAVRRGEIAKDNEQRAVSVIIATLMGASTYANTVGHALGAEAIEGFIDLIDGRLFRVPS
jgi:AcrR family transcriptional regulator